MSVMYWFSTSAVKQVNLTLSTCMSNKLLMHASTGTNFNGFNGFNLSNNSNVQCTCTHVHVPYQVHVELFLHVGHV